MCRESMNDRVQSKKAETRTEIPPTSFGRPTADAFLLVAFRKVEARDVPCRPNVTLSAGPSVSTVLQEKLPLGESSPFPSESPCGEPPPPEAPSASSSIYFRLGLRCLFPPTGSPAIESSKTSG